MEKVNENLKPLGNFDHALLSETLASKMKTRLVQDKHKICVLGYMGGMIASYVCRKRGAAMKELEPFLKQPPLHYIFGGVDSAMPQTKPVSQSTDQLERSLEAIFDRIIEKYLLQNDNSVTFHVLQYAKAWTEGMGARFEPEPEPKFFQIVVSIMQRLASFPKIEKEVSLWFRNQMDVVYDC